MLVSFGTAPLPRQGFGQTPAVRGDHLLAADFLGQLESLAGEALDLAANAIVRLPEKPVAAGEEWTLEWKGAHKQKDNEGIFAFKQKAKLERIEKPVARLSFEITGKLEIPEAKRDKNAEIQETRFEAKGIVIPVPPHEVALRALGGRCGSVVALEPSTGKVLVMASSPTYDQNVIERNFSAIERIQAPCKPVAPLFPPQTPSAAPAQPVAAPAVPAAPPKLSPSQTTICSASVARWRARNSASPIASWPQYANSWSSPR